MATGPSMLDASPREWRVATQGLFLHRQAKSGDSPSETTLHAQQPLGGVYKFLVLPDQEKDKTEFGGGLFGYWPGEDHSCWSVLYEDLV